MRDILAQIAQVLAVLILAPLLQGFIHRYEERAERGRGPSLLQPYRDLWKLFHKQQLIPETATWVFWAAPLVAFVAMMTVPMLIPVLTNYPLPLSDMGDLLGGGFVLTVGTFFVNLAALDTGSAYGGMGASRTSLITILGEPILILVFVGITLMAHSMLPFVVNHELVKQPEIYWSAT
ncbi:MAG: respiratory chain complex I subunit 1 family protein, partial [Rhodanobacteraceae bacterium]